MQILHTLDVLAGAGRLLFMLALVRQVRLVATRRREFALRGIPVFVHVDARVHLLGLLRRYRPSLCRGGTPRSRYLVPLTLP